MSLKPLTPRQAALLTEEVVARAHAWGFKKIIGSYGKQFADRFRDEIEYVNVRLMISAARNFDPMLGIKKIGSFIRATQDKFMHSHVLQLTELACKDSKDPRRLWDLYVVNRLRAGSQNSAPFDRRIEAVATLCSKLTSVEESVIRLRYGLGGEQELSLYECARRLQKTPVQIRKIEVSALKKLGALG